MFDVEKRAVQTPRVEEPNSWRFERSCSVRLERYCVDYTKRVQNAAFETRRFERSCRIALKALAHRTRPSAADCLLSKVASPARFGWRIQIGQPAGGRRFRFSLQRSVE
jgi:hypothetical protein